MYVCYLGHSTNTKNKLEEEFYQFLKEMDRVWCESSQVNMLKTDILNKYKKLCEKHSRCKPIAKEFSAKGWNKKGDFVLYGSNCVFHLLKTK